MGATDPPAGGLITEETVVVIRITKWNPDAGSGGDGDGGGGGDQSDS